MAVQYTDLIIGQPRFFQFGIEYFHRLSERLINSVDGAVAFFCRDLGFTVNMDLNKGRCRKGSDVRMFGIDGNPFKIEKRPVDSQFAAYKKFLRCLGTFKTVPVVFKLLNSCKYLFNFR